MSKSEIIYNWLQKKYTRKINLDRKRIFKILERLDSPHLNLINILGIAGSDGKFSTGFSLLCFLQADRKYCTFFSSPHLFDMRHRVWLKDRYITLNEIKKYEKIVSRTGLKLTLFELITMIYLLAANQQKKIAYHILEAGAGYEKDSTNLWDNPKAQIITNINLQHLDLFKVKTLKDVIRIKVGYLSKNTNIYIGKQTSKVLKIIKKILKKNPSKKIYPSTWSIKNIKGKYYYKDNNNTIPIKSQYIHSSGLLNNLGLAIKIALDFKVKKKIIIKTIPKIKFQGRIDYIKNEKLRKLINKNEKLILDGCHSNASAKNLVSYLKTINEPIYGIWGMQKNKLPEQFIKNFKGIFKKIITVKIPKEPNSLKAKELKQICIKNNFQVEQSINIKDSLKKISSSEKKTIVVFGSLFLCGSYLSKN